MNSLEHFYNIEIDYTTGSSYGSEQLQENLEIVVSDIEKAKENLQRIKRDYLRYQKDNYSYEYKLVLLTDDGEITISPFWIGYFETLHGAKIISELRDDMYFEF